VPIKEEYDEWIKKAYPDVNDDEFVIQQQSMLTLLEDKWLNDEIINGIIRLCQKSSRCDLYFDPQELILFQSKSNGSIWRIVSKKLKKID